MQIHAQNVSFVLNLGQSAKFLSQKFPLSGKVRTFANVLRVVGNAEVQPMSVSTTVRDELVFEGLMAICQPSFSWPSSTFLSIRMTIHDHNKALPKPFSAKTTSNKQNKFK